MSGETLNTNDTPESNNEWVEAMKDVPEQKEAGAGAEIADEYLDLSDRVINLNKAQAHAAYEVAAIERYLNPETDASKYEENGEHVAKLIMERRAKDTDTFKGDFSKYGPARNKDANIAFLQDAKANGTFEQEAQKTIDEFQQKIDMIEQEKQRLLGEQESILDDRRNHYENNGANTEE